jgi:hypothetical protein
MNANQTPVFATVRGYGVDFAWSCPVSSARNFGISYLSYTASKDWTRSCIRRFHAADKATVATFEAGGCDPTKGYSLGYSQAKLAARELAALGAPNNQPFTMSVDCNVAGWRLVPYFRGANAAEPHRVNAFGGYYELRYLYQRHLLGHFNWQTYAWSSGRWLPATVAPLEQYLNTIPFDYDRAVASNYGQWPPPAA